MLPLSDLLRPFASEDAVGIETPRPRPDPELRRSGVRLPRREKAAVEEILTLRLLELSAGDGADRSSGEGEGIGASFGEGLWWKGVVAGETTADGYCPK